MRETAEEIASRVIDKSEVERTIREMAVAPEVTKSMIDAGEATLASKRDAYSDRHLVEAVYTSMQNARLR